MDLLLERGGRVEVAVEIKRSTAPSPSRGFRFAIDALKPDSAYLVHAGTDTWPASAGIVATTLPELMGRLADS